MSHRYIGISKKYRSGPDTGPPGGNPEALRVLLTLAQVLKLLGQRPRAPDLSWCQVRRAPDLPAAGIFRIADLENGPQASCPYLQTAG